MWSCNVLVQCHSDSFVIIVDLTLRTCTNPDVALFPSWKVDDLLTWPICRNDTNSNSSQDHLTCELVGRPCCYGIQASCNITTREHCEFLQGRFHQDAFLCSQVSNRLATFELKVWPVSISHSRFPASVASVVCCHSLSPTNRISSIDFT